MDSPRTTAMGEHDEGIDPIDLALDYMGKAIFWVATQLTPQQVQEIAERINSPTTTTDEISQWFQATLNVMRPLSPHREEQMEDGETLDLDKPDWGVTSESEAEATKTKDRGARPCEKPSASSPTRDIDEDAHKEKVKHDDHPPMDEEYEEVQVDPGDDGPICPAVPHPHLKSWWKQRNIQLHRGATTSTTTSPTTTSPTPPTVGAKTRTSHQPSAMQHMRQHPAGALPPPHRTTKKPMTVYESAPCETPSGTRWEQRHESAPCEIPSGTRHWESHGGQEEEGSHWEQEDHDARPPLQRKRKREHDRVGSNMGATMATTNPTSMAPSPTTSPTRGEDLANQIRRVATTTPKHPPKRR